MASLNKVLLMGNLTRDPEIRHTPKGTAVGDLAMAINMSYKAQDGTDRDEVCYVDVVVWGRQAETCHQYLKKGSPLFVEGRLQLDQWQTQEGEKKSRLRVRGERVQFLSGGTRSSGGPSEHTSSAGGYRSDAKPEPGYSGGSSASSYNPSSVAQSDDDIPF
ncbi:MAG: single-stranded DNA-binding protein [Verrucomicrobiota bacterium]